jgi:hypothetical protein
VGKSAFLAEQFAIGIVTNYSTGIELQPSVLINAAKG